MVKNYEEDEVVEAVRAAEKETLLKKYDIPVHHLDFKYVETCTNAKEIEQILEILKSGEEGHYFELQKCVEERLFVLNPKSKSLRKVAPVLSKYDLQKSEWESLSTDIQNFVDQIKESDLELSSFQNINPLTNKIPIRQLNNPKNKTQSSNKKVNRIRSMDYSSWDKLDVDAEILKIDLREEKEQKEALQKEEEKAKQNLVVVNPDFMTRAELENAAIMHRQLGNDYFRAQEYEEALQYYTNSITFLPTIDAYNNRSVTSMKLMNYEDAVSDCVEVLKMDNTNEKAMTRMVEALTNLDRHDQAKELVQHFIMLYPNNVVAQSYAFKLRQQDKAVNTIRMQIQTVGDVSEDEFFDFMMPIAHSSMYYGPPTELVTVRLSQLKKIGKSVFPNSDEIPTINLNTQKPRTKHSELFLYYGDLRRGDMNDFIRYWIRHDLTNFQQHEAYLRRIKPTDISTSLGNVLTEGLFLTIIYCLKEQFVFKTDMQYIRTILTELSKFPTFEKVMTGLKSKNKTYELRYLLGIVQKYEYKFPKNVLIKYTL